MSGKAPLKQMHSGRKKIRPIDRRLAIVGGLVSAAILTALFVWVIAWLPVFSVVWLIIGVALFGGLAAGIAIARSSGWRAFTSIFSLYGYGVFAHEATACAWNPVGFGVLTFFFGSFWMTGLIAPQQIAEVWGVIEKPRSFWMKLYKAAAWIVLVFLVLIIYTLTAVQGWASDCAGPGLYFYGWGLIMSFLASLTIRSRNL